MLMRYFVLNLYKNRIKNNMSKNLTPPPAAGLKQAFCRICGEPLAPKAHTAKKFCNPSHLYAAKRARILFNLKNDSHEKKIN